MDYLNDILFELAYELDFYIDSEDECRRALFLMAYLNERNSEKAFSIYSEEDFLAIKKHINENF
ncbi:hypothetical protein [uncultured Clostridium sp.]|uniref:hypothetical protein n=1 Tax=uncultured Clostridium sp. TaxID=59620 RepID=UPI00261DBBCF|nr:hypothetical protein [uncultured Clostridium sp.]